MLLARTVHIERLDEARAFARRVGLAEESARQAAKGISRPIQILLTGLAPGTAARLRDAGRRPEREGAAPVVLTGGGEAALVAGSRWSVFSLATTLGLGDDPELGEVGGALTRCLSRTERPAASLPLGDRVLDLDGHSRVMGIVNVTPDSFSDGGRYLDPGRAAAHGAALAEAGAAILDVGGESTRPGADEVAVDEEIRRVVPVVRRLADAGHLVSVDTRKAAVARAALDAGAVMVNDVSGLSDPEMASAVAAARAGLVVMHMRGTPATMQQDTRYEDVVGEVLLGLARAVADALEAGVEEARVVVDPGIGFAKTAEQNLVLLRRLPALLALGRPILVGPSRKAFIGRLTGAPPEARLPGTLAAVVLAARGGARLLRVHDVAEAVQALAVTDAVLAADADGEAFEEGSVFWSRTDPRVGGASR